MTKMHLRPSCIQPTKWDSENQNLIPTARCILSRKSTRTRLLMKPKLTTVRVNWKEPMLRPTLPHWMIFSLGTHTLFQVAMIQRYCLRSSLNSSLTRFRRFLFSLILPRMKQRLWMTLMSYNYIPPQVLSSMVSMKCRLRRFESWLAVALTRLVHWIHYQLGCSNHVCQLFYNHWVALWIHHFHLDIFLKPLWHQSLTLV